MIAPSVAIASTIRLAVHYLLVAFTLVLNAPSAASSADRGTACYVAVTAVVSTPAPYQVRRVVTTGVREYNDDGTGTVSYCQPIDIARLGAARAAVDRRIAQPRDGNSNLADSNHAENVEHVVIRSTSPNVVAQHLVYVAAAGHGASGFAGVEVVALKAPDSTEYREFPLPSLSATERDRAACDSANAVLRRNAAAFHWAC